MRMHPDIGLVTARQAKKVCEGLFVMAVQHVND